MIFVNDVYFKSLLYHGFGALVSLLPQAQNIYGLTCIYINGFAEYPWKQLTDDEDTRGGKCIHPTDRQTLQIFANILYGMNGIVSSLFYYCLGVSF